MSSIKYKPKMKPCGWKDCENQFIPRFKSTEKFCSSECTWKDKKEKQNSKSIKKNIIPRRSLKRTKQERVYLGKRIVFLNKPENKYCAVYKNKLATEVHHKKGRIGKLLTDERFWLAVSRDGHEHIESNPKEAKEKGWSLSRLSTTDG